MLATSETISIQRRKALLRDLAVGMHQQMFFWGRDVVHPDGNLFLERGFEKSSCDQLPGSSLYRLAWQGGGIELHGSQAGWFGPEGGFVYLRTHGRCYHWAHATPPIPGASEREALDARDPDILFRFVAPFLDWWIDHENQVIDRHGLAYRTACFRHFGRLPKSRSWLSPADGLRWIRQLRDEPDRVPRARRFTSMISRP